MSDTKDVKVKILDDIKEVSITVKNKTYNVRVGDRFNDLKIIQFCRIPNGISRVAYKLGCICLCKCGNVTKPRILRQVVTGEAKSCGCGRRGPKDKEKNTTTIMPTSSTEVRTKQGYMITFEGQTKSLKEWAGYYNMNYWTAASRHRKGWSFEEIFDLNKPKKSVQELQEPPKFTQQEAEKAKKHIEQLTLLDNIEQPLQQPEEQIKEQPEKQSEELTEVQSLLQQEEQIKTKTTEELQPKVDCMIEINSITFNNVKQMQEFLESVNKLRADKGLRVIMSDVRFVSESN